MHTVFVIGGAGFMGQHLVRYLAAQRHRVIATFRPGSVPAAVPGVEWLPADLATAEGIESVVTRTVEAFGGLDILVNNVGLARGAGIADTGDAEWAEAFEAPARPYRWRDATRVRDRGPGRRFVMRTTAGPMTSTAAITARE